MLQVTIKETREQLASIIEQVSVGNKQFLITKFNKPKAMIIPIDETLFSNNAKKLENSFGAWKSRKDIKNSAKWVAKLRARTSTRHAKISS